MSVPSGPSSAPICLFVEDDRSARELGITQLEALGLRVVAAVNGTDALDKLTQIKPDLLVTDLCMPGLDGIGLTRLFKRLHPKVPILACSAVYPHESAEARQLLKAGADNFVAKPLRARDLRGMIHSLLGGVPAQPSTPEPAASARQAMPGVAAEYAYEQLARAETERASTTVALVGMSGRMLSVRAPKGFARRGEAVSLRLAGRVLVGDQVVDLNGTLEGDVVENIESRVRTEVLGVEIRSADSVEAWRALSEYLRLRTPT